MADKIIETLLAQIDTEALLTELRRRLGVAGQLTESSGESATLGAAPSGSREPITMGVIQPDAFFRLSNPEAIRKFLSIMKRPQSPRAIVDGLKAGGVLSQAKNFYATVWTELKRAEDRGEIVNTPAGWALSEWYAGKAKPADNGKKPGRASKRGQASRRVKKGRNKPKFTPQLKSAHGAAAAPQTYQQFVSEGAKAGKNLKQIAEEWRARKSGGQK